VSLVSSISTYILVFFLEELTQLHKTIVVTEVHKHEIPEVPKFRDDYNAFTWMMDATNTQMEQIHVVGFAIYYRQSKLLL
jgi:hypothetical protein